MAAWECKDSKVRYFGRHDTTVRWVLAWRGCSGQRGGWWDATQDVSVGLTWG